MIKKLIIIYYKLFWNLRLKLQILFGGGRVNFIFNRIKKRELDKAVNINLALHIGCYYSIFNKRWCDLPCIFCKKFKECKVKK